MGTRVMGVVGVRRSSVENMEGAVRAGVSSRHGAASSPTAPYAGAIAVKSEELERKQVIDPARKQAVVIPFRHRSRRVRYRYHTQAGTKGEALGYMTARKALFLATPSMLPLGTSLVLEAAEGDQAAESQTMRGMVTAICPGTDEFGFPPGVGLYVSEGFDMLKGGMMSRGTQSRD